MQTHSWDRPWHPRRRACLVTWTRPSTRWTFLWAIWPHPTGCVALSRKARFLPLYLSESSFSSASKKLSTTFEAPWSPQCLHRLLCCPMAPRHTPRPAYQAPSHCRSRQNVWRCPHLGTRQSRSSTCFAGHGMSSSRSESSERACSALTIVLASSPLALICIWHPGSVTQRLRRG